MATTMTTSEVLVEVSCASCGLRFGLPESYAAEKRKTHQEFYCPNGHSLSFPGKTDADRLRDLQGQIVTERQRADQRHAELRDLAERERRRAAAARGQVTKVRNRVGRGVCPCCNRYFADLHRHMTGQHPDFMKAAYAE